MTWLFFFKRLVESTKELFRKELETYRLTYNELQTVLYETEAILKKHLVTYYYKDESECCLTPIITYMEEHCSGIILRYCHSHTQMQVYRYRTLKINHILIHF